MVDLLELVSRCLLQSLHMRVADTIADQDRMVWGSGTPEIVDVHMSEYTEEERAMVKGGNLELLLPWPSVSKPSL